MSLVMGMKDHHGKGWNAFDRVYRPVVCVYCLRRGLQDADAQDVTQAVMLKVAAAASGFEYDPKKGRFRDWLRMLTQRAVIDHLRRRGQATGGEAEFLEEALATQSSSSEWNDCFDAKVLSEALSIVEPEFEPATWAIFLAIWREGRPAAEVAGEHGVQVATAYAYKSKARKRIEEVMRGLADDLPAYQPLS